MFACIKVVGGAGRVGLPLSVLLAERLPHVRITIVDTATTALAAIRHGQAPFWEAQLQERLRAVCDKNLDVSEDLGDVNASTVVVITLAGRMYDQGKAVSPCLEFITRERERLCNAAALLYTGTLPPGLFRRMRQEFDSSGCGLPMAYCPERFAEGAALQEMATLPQIIASDCAAGYEFARAVFGAINPNLSESSVEEAEIIKLLTNTWRYMEFAVANQIAAILQQHGVDYTRAMRLMRDRYPRLAGRPTPGFAGGPCLPNDVRILVDSGFTAPMASAALEVNSTLPQVITDMAAKKITLRGATVAVLGMAFKAESDDRRGTLSEALVDLLRGRGANVLCSDEYIQDEAFVPLSTALRAADLLIIAVPHAAYAKLQLQQPYIDLWGIVSQVPR